MHDVPLLGDADIRARHAEEPAEAAEQTEIQPPTVVEADTAFMVVSIGGEWIVTHDLKTVVMPKRHPTADDITGAAANLMRDRSAEIAAQVIGATLPELVAEAVAALFERKQQEAMDKMNEARIAHALRQERH